MKKAIKTLTSSILCSAFLAGSLVFNPNVTAVNAVQYADTQEEILAVVEFSEISPELSATLAEFGLTEYNVDELLVVQGSPSTRGSSVNELKVVQESNDETAVSYLMAFDENMVQMDYVTYMPATTRASKTLTVTDADCRFTFTAGFYDISRSTYPTNGRFFRPTSISMSYTTNESLTLSEVTLSLQTEGIRCNSDFTESEPYDGNYIYYIETSFNDIPPGRTISGYTVRPSSSGYVKYSGDFNSGVWTTIEGETSTGRMFGFTRPMHTN